MEAATADWAALEAAARVVHTPCGDGRMVWRLWGEGAPLVLLHGGAGSWLHWLKTIPAFRTDRLVIAPDLPGLGGSADLPADAADGGVAIVAAGLDEVLGPAGAPDLVGFSFGGYVAGSVGARHAAASVTLVGSGGLGVIRRTSKLERVRDKTGAEREAAHRTNLHRWMIADPARIDAQAVAIQDWNSRHARLDSRPFGGSDALLEALPRVTARLAGIWGQHDHAVAGETDRPRDVLRRFQPDVPFHVIEGAGHWVAYEAPDAFAAALRSVLAPAPDATERPRYEHA